MGKNKDQIQKISELPMKFIVFALVATALASAGYFFEKSQGGASAAGFCPAGYYEVSDFCIEGDVHDGGATETWFDAAEACAVDEEARLCTASELTMVSDLAGITVPPLPTLPVPTNIGDSGSEWSDDFATGEKALSILTHHSSVFSYDAAIESRPYRCCKNK